VGNSTFTRRIPAGYPLDIRWMSTWSGYPRGFPRVSEGDPEGKWERLGRTGGLGLGFNDGNQETGMNASGSVLNRARLEAEFWCGLSETEALLLELVASLSDRPKCFYEDKAEKVVD
jgi:hypothetical protein